MTHTAWKSQYDNQTTTGNKLTYFLISWPYSEALPDKYQEKTWEPARKSVALIIRLITLPGVKCWPY